ncbi:MAG: MFS transporter [Acidimicrobiales bacterium]
MRLRERYPVPAAVVLVLVAQFVARLPMGMYSVALVLAVVHWTSSFATAGAAVAGFNLAGGVIAPLVGRLADRHDPRPILGGLALGHALAVVLLVATAEGLPHVVFPVLAAVAGGCMPPIGPALKATWSRRFDSEDRVLRAVFGLESVLGEAVYLLGPALAGAATALGGEPFSLLTAGALTLGGTAAIIAGSTLAHPLAGATRSGPSAAALRSRGLQILLVTQALSFVAFSGISLGVLALAEAQGLSATGALLLSVWAAGAAIGALIWGARAQWPGTQAQQLHAVLWLVAATSGAVALAGAALPAVAATAGWALLGAALLAAGVALAPGAIVEATLVGQVTAVGRRTESYAWLGTAALVGSAAGSALFGLLVAQWGGAAALIGAVVTAAAAAMIAGLGRPALELPTAVADRGS